MMVTLQGTLLFATVLLISCITIAFCQEHGHTHRELYVKSTPTQQCPQHHQCHTLLSYLQNGTASFTSNTTVHFLPGNHSATVSQPMTLVISNISNLALRGPEVGPDEPPVAHIWCNYTMQFQFIDASNVSMKGLKIQKCGMYNPLTLSHIFENCDLSTIPSAVKFVNVHFIAIEKVHIIHSHGFGLLVWNYFGYVSVYNSDFDYNGRENFGTALGFGGNALFYHNIDTFSTEQTDVQIISSTFRYGHTNSNVCLERNNKYLSYMGMSGGLSILFDSEAGLSDIVITISDSSFHNNQADSGANIMVLVINDQQPPHVYLSILNSSFINGTALDVGGGLYLGSLYSCRISGSRILGNSASFGGGIYHDNKPGDVLVIYGSIFSDNLASMSGGGLYVRIVSDDDGEDTIPVIPTTPSAVVNISNTTFTRNSAVLDGGGVFLQDVGTVLIFTTLFSQNEANTGGSGMRISTFYILSIHSYCIENSTFFGNDVTAAIELRNVQDCWIYGTKFIDNGGGSIEVSTSNISLQGHVEFSGNTAQAGAAILLKCRGLPSFLTFLPNTTVTVTNNTALYYGGGIAVDPECNYGTYCVFQLPSMINIGNSNHRVAYFDSNKAYIAGNSIYGPSVSQCRMMDGVLGEHMLMNFFNIKGGFSSDQVVLAQIYSICFCDVNTHRELSCSTKLDKDIFPGEEFSVRALITGKLNDPLRGFVRAHLDTYGDSDSQLGITCSTQEIQVLEKSCDRHLTYSVMTTAEIAVIDIQNEGVPNAPHSFINITVLQCPIGFKFDNDQRKCDCNEYLRSKLSQITCDITLETVNVSGNVWIGNLSNNRLGAHQHCPFDYCNPELHSIDLSNQHQQCTSNRSGVMCGACNSGFSLALGTARCLDNCSHYYLFLIIPFALAGVAIVFILLKCNLTVSMGTTNALIFYANIIHIKRTIFFPQSNVTIITRFLAVFIAWLNLDLGIETCLYRGMTAYANTWLQFVFPVYIWLLVLIMIYSSRYSVTASKLIGRNAVSALTTLFLLSYAKLLRTTIAVVSPISIEDEDRKVYLLWLMDGNVSYFSAPHAVLFIIALVAILLYIVPLTLLTLLAPYLQARTNHRAMRWVIRIKPLLDAYQGPYNDKYRYWTGVMFLQRIVLFTVFAANTVGNPNINLFAICVSITIALIYQIYRGKLYKNRLNWLLEGFYSFNLAIYTFGVLSLKDSQSSLEYLSCVMVGSVFIVFCLTVIWHINYQTTVISRAVKKMKYHLGNQRRRQAEGSQEATDPPPPPLRQPQPTVSVIDMKELREPLLTDN